MNQEKHTVRVTICGTEYPIKADADPTYIMRIAQYVDTRMRAIPDTASSTPSLMGVAILTALSIADELHREREEKARVITQLDDQIATLVRQLDEVLV